MLWSQGVAKLPRRIVLELSTERGLGIWFNKAALPISDSTQDVLIKSVSKGSFFINLRIMFIHLNQSYISSINMKRNSC